MNAIRPVFVYGTLRPEQPGFEELALSTRVDVLGPARVAGVLYDLGDYPGAVLGGDGFIRGELFRLRNGDVLGQLDAFEMFDPDDPIDQISGSLPPRSIRTQASGFTPITGQ